jgi:hypothetical protein
MEAIKVAGDHSKQKSQKSSFEIFPQKSSFETFEIFVESFI